MPTKTVGKKKTNKPKKSAMYKKTNILKKPLAKKKATVPKKAAVNRKTNAPKKSAPKKRANTVLMRTSISHPLQAGIVDAGPGFGRIHLTLCPGKKGADTTSRAWNRDMSLDLDAIFTWGTTAVLTLLEAQELKRLKVPHLGQEVALRHMLWFHLPIIDGSTPGERFEQSWTWVGEQLRWLLRHGFHVTVHCKTGLGRAGTIGARLLTELGVAPNEAIRKVREACRRSAIETREQKDFVLGTRTIAEALLSGNPEAVKNRALGCLLGLAAGDAVGTTLEFRQRDTYEPLQDMIGGGPFNLKPGEWTDDTSMALALACTLLETADFDEQDLLGRFDRWHRLGENSCTGTCFDIGITVRGALDEWRRTRAKFSGATEPHSAGNGSLMRLAPVALRFWNDRQKLRDVASRQSRTTHGAPEAVEACALFAEILADAIEGKSRADVLRSRPIGYGGKIGQIAAGSWHGKSRNEIQSSGYVVHSLEAALWCVASTVDFESAALKAANLGGDADTIAAITGQLAGALYGIEGIPDRWRERIAWRERIETLGSLLLQKSAMQ